MSSRRIKKKAGSPCVLLDPLPTIDPNSFKVKLDNLGACYTPVLIDKNIGYVKELDLWDDCKCSTPNCCGDGSCINRSTNVECQRCVDECLNQRIQKKEFAYNFLEVVINPLTFAKIGASLETKKFISKGTIIGEYVGEIVTLKQYEKRLRTIYAKDRHNYGMQLGPKHVIDATKFGNLIRFANHSCYPSCEIEQWNVGDFRRCVLVASTDIPAGGEITFNYKFYHYGNPKWECTCSKKCTAVACNECGKTFGTRSGRNQHIVAIHVNKGKGYLCPGCGENYRYKNNLTRHLKSCSSSSQ